MNQFSSQQQQFQQNKQINLHNYSNVNKTNIKNIKSRQYISLSNTVKNFNIQEKAFLQNIKNNHNKNRLNYSRNSYNHTSITNKSKFNLQKNKNPSRSIIMATNNSSLMPNQQHILSSAKSNSKSFIVYNLSTRQIIFQYQSNLRLQIASITKIMTAYITIKFINQYQLNPNLQYYSVSSYAASIKGTSAQLQESDKLSLLDLLYGLMLPSGNDAAVCIAQNIGKYLKLKKKKNQQLNSMYNSNTSTRASNYSKNSDYSISKISKKNQFLMKQYEINIEHFVNQMNLQAERLQMKGTQFNNPHGLPDPKNYSNCEDLILLIQQALKDPLFKKIISKKLYFAMIQDKSEWTKQLLWENTNRLLLKGFQGIKTGNTQNAGFCLASWYKKQQNNLITIVLGCKSKDQRDQITVKLTQLGIDKIKREKDMLNTQISMNEIKKQIELNYQKVQHQKAIKNINKTFYSTKKRQKEIIIQKRLNSPMVRLKSNYKNGIKLRYDNKINFTKDKSIKPNLNQLCNNII